LIRMLFLECHSVTCLATIRRDECKCYP